MSKHKARYRRFIVLMFFFVALTTSQVYAQTPTYPQPPPGNIEVHSTKISYYGKPTSQFTFNIQQIDNQSVVTELSLNTSVPLSSLGVHTFQLSNFPVGVPARSDSLLIIKFSLPENVDKKVTSASIYFKIPKTVISGANVEPNSLKVQRYSQGWWRLLSSKVISSSSQFVILQAQSPGLSVFAITGTALPTPFPWLLLIIAVVTIAAVVATYEVLVRRRRARNWEERKVIVIGGASFVGSHLDDKFHSLGAKITVILNLSGGKLKDLRSSLAREQTIRWYFNTYPQRIR